MCYLMNVSEPELQTLFKRIPTANELNKFRSNLLSLINNKLDPNYIEQTYAKKLKKNGYASRLDCLNDCVSLSLQELSTNISSSLFVGIQKYVKKPYSNEISNMIISLFNLLEDINEKYYNENKTNFLIFVLVCILGVTIYSDENVHSLEIPKLNLYYGDYNIILDTICIEETNSYWMGEKFNWDGYTSESVVVIPMMSSIVPNIYNIFSLLRSCVMNNVKKLIIVTSSLPSQINLDNTNLSIIREFSVNK